MASVRRTAGTLAASAHVAEACGNDTMGPFPHALPPPGWEFTATAAELQMLRCRPDQPAGAAPNRSQLTTAPVASIPGQSPGMLAWDYVFGYEPRPVAVSEANPAVGWDPDGFAGRAGRARALPGTGTIVSMEA